MIPNLDWEDVAFLIKCLRSFLECNWLGLILEKPIICPFNLNEHSFILPLWASWPSPVAQLVKNPPATWETWVQSLGWEDPLVKGKATHSIILAWRILIVHCVAKSQTFPVIYCFFSHTYRLLLATRKLL